MTLGILKDDNVYFRGWLMECVSLQVCHEFNSTWAWELENKGYKDMSVECKTGILKVRLQYRYN